MCKGCSEAGLCQYVHPHHGLFVCNVDGNIDRQLGERLGDDDYGDIEQKDPIGGESVWKLRSRGRKELLVVPRNPMWEVFGER